MKLKFKLIANEGNPNDLPELKVFLQGRGESSSRHVTLIVGGREVFHLYEDGDYIFDDEVLSTLGFKRYIG
jgi:hypothetical protein